MRERDCMRLLTPKVAHDVNVKTAAVGGSRSGDEESSDVIHGFERDRQHFAFAWFLYKVQSTPS